MEIRLMFFKEIGSGISLKNHPNLHATRTYHFRRKNQLRDLPFFK